ncbi:hypothetical protein [Actinorugispora endophytica]|uniref:DUF4175 domain-containing protein n=1 Tax=Actinorugispora endophytica TaxID=1605990 RepID=A0A4V3D6N1_9ACTN|nr:hypothetical protein [Actinorugispora endophytica]TDQ44587.1 hypothetical protein EV190_13516 [Actinorugispora endophytica]
MYGLIWRGIPGPWFVKLVVCLALVAGATALLWYVVFPWADPYLPFNDVTVGGTPASDGGAPAGEASPGQ